LRLIGVEPTQIGTVSQANPFGQVIGNAFWEALAEKADRSADGRPNTLPTRKTPSG